MLRRIGAEEGGEFKAVASGTLPSGRPVIVNADGTVSAVSSTAVSQALGSTEVFESASTDSSNVAYDSYNQRIVVAYKDKGNSNQGTAIVGTVNANNTVTYGTAVVFETGQTDYINVMFDSSNNKIVIVFRDVGDSNKAKGIVGTVDPSDNSISFGSASSGFASSTVDELSAAYTTGGKVVAAYRDTHNSNYGNSNVGTVSGTSITFGSSTYFETAAVDKTSVGYDTANDKVLIFYIDAGNSDYPTAIVGTVSGTTLSYGTATVVTSAGASIGIAQAYDTDQQKFGLFFKASSEGKAAVATISGTSVTASLKTPLAAFENNAPRYISAVYHQASKKIVVAYEDDGDSFKGKIALPQISGTNMLDPDGTMPSASGQGSPVVFDSSSLTERLGVAYDSVNKKAVIAYSDGGNSEHGSSVVFTPSYNDNNLTSENYIGMSRGVAFQSPVTEGVGSSVQYKTASIADHYPVIFDSNSNKVVIAYQDAGDSNKGKARVGTVNGTSISFGTEATWSTSNLYQGVNGVFDSSNNKIVIVYRDSGNSSYGTAIIGTVSGTDITFGSPVVFNSANSFWFGIAFDSTNNKVVIAYRDQGNNSGYGSAIVGTVSGTSISFGSEATLESSVCSKYELAYDTTNEKIVAVYVDGSSQGPLRSKVGTVSGTSISFGSEVTVDSDNCTSPKILFNPDTGTTIVTYTSNTDSFRGTSKIGTVSGTSISFSSESIFATTGDSQSLAYDSTAQKIVIAYRDTGNGYDGYIVVGTVGASSITYGTPLEFADYNVEWFNSAFDSNSNKVVIIYSDQSNSNYGTAIVFQNTGTETIRGQVTNGQNASVDVIGSVSDNQIGLTAGQQYFVQTDGTISTTAGTPSVLAGTAISATELVVKT
jgi:hypothetical protein